MPEDPTELTIEKLDLKPGDIILIQSDVEDFATLQKAANRVSKLLPKGVKSIWMRKSSTLELLTDDKLERLGLQRIPKE